MLSRQLNKHLRNTNSKHADGWGAFRSTTPVGFIILPKDPDGDILHKAMTLAQICPHYCHNHNNGIWLSLISARRQINKGEEEIRCRPCVEEWHTYLGQASACLRGLPARGPETGSSASRNLLSMNWFYTFRPIRKILATYLVQCNWKSRRQRHRFNRDTCVLLGQSNLTIILPRVMKGKLRYVRIQVNHDDTYIPYPTSLFDYF